MLFLIPLYLMKAFTHRSQQENIINCCSDSDSISDVQVNRTGIIKIRNTESPCSYKNTLIAFQQIEFSIRRCSSADVQIIKDNSAVFGKAIADALLKSNDVLTAQFADLTAQLIRSVTAIIENEMQEFLIGISKLVNIGVAELINANSLALTDAQIAFFNAGVVLNSLGTAALIEAEIANPSSVFNLSVMALIANQAAENILLVKNFAAQLTVPTDALLNKLRVDITRAIVNEIELFAARQLVLLKANTAGNVQDVEAIVISSRDSLILALEQRNFRLFETVRFLLEICKEEITGERIGGRRSNPFQPSFPGWENGGMGNEFSMLMSTGRGGLGINN